MEVSAGRVQENVLYHLRAFLMQHPRGESEDKVRGKVRPVVRLDVVIPTWNSARLLPEVLRRVKEHLRPDSVIVVDRRSEDGTRTIAQSFGCEVLEDVISLGSARMKGIARSQGDLIAFIDDDILVDRGFRESMLRYMDDSTGAIQGFAVSVDPTVADQSKKHVESMLGGKEAVALKRGNRGYTNATIVRRSLLGDLDISDMNAYEDFAIAKHVMDKGYVWKLVPVYVGHDHSGQANVFRSAWNYAGIWNLGRTGRLSMAEAWRYFARAAWTHPVHIARSLRSNDQALFLIHARSFAGAIISPLYMIRTMSRKAR